MKSLPKKLSLNKETIRVLSGAEMRKVVGGRMAGDDDSHGCSCTCKCTKKPLC